MRFDGTKLKAHRDARTWDQHRLAEAARSHGVGVTQSQISRYENGKQPSSRNAMALAAALGVEPRELFSDDEPAEAATMTAATADSLAEVLRELIRTEVRDAMKAAA